jgi:general stress protein 26
MELREKILEVIGGPHTAAVATLDGKMPVVRFMLLLGFPDMTLVGGTMKTSRKVVQLEKNADVDIAVWSGKEFTDPYVEIRAKAKIHEDIATKKKYWNPMFVPYFRSVDNPDFVILLFTASEISYYIPSMRSRDVWKR